MLVDIEIPEHINRLEKGIYLSDGSNVDHIIDKKLTFEQKYPRFNEIGDSDFLNSYGVCDTPKQFLSRFRDILEKDHRELIVSFMYVPKDNGWRWRWHKWGAYVGEFKPTKEYLDEEKGFKNGVYCFHIYSLT